MPQCGLESGSVAVDEQTGRFSCRLSCRFKHLCRSPHEYPADVAGKAKDTTHTKGIAAKAVRDAVSLRRLLCKSK